MNRTGTMRKLPLSLPTYRDPLDFFVTKVLTAYCRAPVMNAACNRYVTHERFMLATSVNAGTVSRSACGTDAQ